jgi:toxin FitB
VTTWLIDTFLFKSLSQGSKKLGLRTWIEANDDPIFLSSASIVLLAAAIQRIPSSQKGRADALRPWLDGLTANFGDRILPVDVEVALRAGAFLRPTQSQARLHDALLLATAAVHGHTFLTMRSRDFNRVRHAGQLKIQFLE